MQSVNKGGTAGRRHRSLMWGLYVFFCWRNTARQKVEKEKVMANNKKLVEAITSMEEDLPSGIQML